MDAIETWKRNGCTCEIRYDDTAESPFVQHDNAGEIHTWAYSERNSWDGCNVIPYDIGERCYQASDPDRLYCRYLTLTGGYAVAVPVYLSGSGIEVAAMTWETFDREYGSHGGRSPENIEHARNLIEAEASELRAWIEGDVYGWVVKFPDGTQESVWGYYGDREYVETQANGTADAWVDEAAIEAGAEGWATFA